MNPSLPLARASLIVILLFSVTTGSCTQYDFTGPLTEEDRIGQSFFEFYFSENTGGTFFLFQIDQPGLKDHVYETLRKRFASENLAILQKHSADIRYERLSENEDSVIVLIDPGTNRPGTLIGITSISFVGADSADVSVHLSWRGRVTTKEYVLARESREKSWRVVGFPDLIVHTRFD